MQNAKNSDNYCIQHYQLNAIAFAVIDFCVNISYATSKCNAKCNSTKLPCNYCILLQSATSATCAHKLLNNFKARIR